MSAEWVTVTKGQIEKARELLHGFPGATRKVLAKSVNRSITSVRTEAVRKTREIYTVKARDVRDTIHLTRSKPSRLTGVISSVGSALPLSSFDHRPTTVNGKRRTPIRVTVKRGEHQALDRAFIARVGGNKSIYERVGKKRMPIRKLYSLSVPQMIGNEGTVQSMADKARETMDKRLDHEIDRVLNGRSP